MGTKRNEVKKYPNGGMTSNEQQFAEILERQEKNYPFLKHPKTPDEIRTVCRNIVQRVVNINTMAKKKLAGTLGMITMIILLALTGCNKDFNTPQTPPRVETISQQFFITTSIKDMPNKKSYDPSTFVVQYSDVKYELKISNANNTYTKQVSINELRAGTITFQMVAGIYNITYNPSGLAKFTTVLNISVNNTAVAINGSPVTLQGTFIQSLIIVDIKGIQPYSGGNLITNFTHMTAGGDDYWFSYTGQNITVVDDFGIYENESGMIKKWVVINPLLLGKIYWIQSNMGVQNILNLPALEVLHIAI
jgi:hypothetical protein